MSILEEEVLVSLTSNVRYYENLGYQIPRYKNKDGKYVIRKGTQLLVKTGDLSKYSKALITKVCDNCGQHTENKDFGSVIRSRVKNNGIDLCRDCSYKHGWKTRYSNIQHDKTLEYWAKANNKEYLLDEFSSKNTLKPNELFKTTHKIIIWNCLKCKSEYSSSVLNRTNGSTNCPYCAGVKVNQTNCLWNTNPKVAEMLEDKNIGYDVVEKSNKRTNFICPDCKHLIVNKPIFRVTMESLHCPKCSDNNSFPEKFTLCMLEQSGISFEKEKVFKWSDNKRYDFYIPSLNCIIETHGNQHYMIDFSYCGGRTLEEERENDNLKEKLAKDNGIKHYIVIDCRRSELEWIKQSIINSPLDKLITLSKINWNKCNEFASKNLIKETCELWSNNKNVKEIAYILGLSKTTIRNYLKRGNELGWCVYILNNKRKVMQISLDGEPIREWNSIQEAENSLNISSISRACLNNKKSAGGYLWMYHDDFLINKNKLKPYSNQRLKKVVQLSLNNEFIKLWGSIKEASENLNIGQNNISRVLTGKGQTSGGYKWMYFEEYKNKKL